MSLCEEPEWFDKDFLISIGLVEKMEEGLVLCGLAQAKEKGEGKTDEDGSETKKATEVGTSLGESSPAPEKSEIPEPLLKSSEQNPRGQEEKWQRIIEFMMQKFGEASSKQQEFLTLQNKNMSQALSLVERMTNLAEQNNQITL